VAEVQWLTEGEQRVWRSLLAFQAALLGRLDHDLQSAHGVSLGDYDVLVSLSEAPEGSLRMAELAARCALSPSGLTRRVDSLARAGLVSRQPCAQDGRGWFAVISDQGRRRLEEAAPVHVAGVRRYLFDGLAGSSLDSLASGVAALQVALDQPGSEPVRTSPPLSIQPLVPPLTETAR
jgi:DNA-binding MarR family transcriptional regulator